MVRFRETTEDLIRQKRLFEVFSNSLNVNYKQFSSYSKKYRIDGFCYNSNTKDIINWVECKWYTTKAHCYLNIPKFKELIDLSEITSLPSYFLFREYERWGYILLHDGKKIRCNYKVKLAGGTPKGRVVNEDDIEPLILLDTNNIVWGN